MHCRQSACVHTYWNVQTEVQYPREGCSLLLRQVASFDLLAALVALDAQISPRAYRHDEIKTTKNAQRSELPMTKLGLQFGFVSHACNTMRRDQGGSVSSISKAA